MDEVTLCNIALANLGVSIQIDSLDQRSKEALACKLIYAQTRDLVLSEGHWPFARQTVALQQTGTPSPLWKYRYAYPDCLKLRKVFPGVPAGVSAADYRRVVAGSSWPHEVATAGDGSQVIDTDVETAYAIISLRVVDPNRFTAAFASAFEWKLTSLLALPLAKGPEYSKYAAQAYDREIHETLAAALNEETPDEELDCALVMARR